MSDRQYTPEEIEAALNGDPVDETPETPEETSAPEESAPAEEAPEGDDAEAEPEVAEEPEEPEAVEDDWQEKFRKLQAAKDREIAQVRREAQEAREEAIRWQTRQEALQEQREQQEAQINTNVSTEQLQAGIENNLPATFQWTVTNRPDLVPSLITMVREAEGLGNPIADQMVVEYTNYQQEMIRQEQQAALEEIRGLRESDQAPLRQREAMEDVVGSLTERFGDNFEAVKDEIATRMDTQGREYVAYLMQEAVKNGDDPNEVVTPALLKEMMVDIYLELREEAMNTTSNAPQQAQSVPAGAGAIGGSATTPDDPDDDGEFLASFVSGAKSANISVDPKFLP